MTNTIKLSLAKALKLKNRLAGRLAKLMTDIQTYNSIQQGGDTIDVRARMDERAELVRLLIELKYAISAANIPIQKSIFELAERKAEAAMLSGLGTKHGVYQEGYPNAGNVTYVAQYRKADVDTLVQKLESEIDRIQDQLDAFNHETTIDVDLRIVELARE